MKLMFTIAVMAVVFASGPSVAIARQPQPLKVQIGQEKKAPGSGLRIKFVELVEDSRCPENTNCIWAGNAKIKVRVAKNGRSKVLELDTMPMSKEPVRFGSYILKLVKLTPAPREGARLNRNAYEASIAIAKAPK